MARNNEFKLTLNLESLEGRSLQSGLVLGDSPVISSPPSAVIGSNTPLTSPNLSPHNYHSVTGFFGQ